jgi:hypothetical protein
MYGVCVLFLVSGGYPFWVAWRANRRTALVHALGWSIAAWTAWIASVLVGWAKPETDSGAVRYLALCLTGCAMVAVLGARQPGAAAWNFVVVGLLAILLLPLAEQTLSRGKLQIECFRAVLLGGVLAVGVVNYLPTRLGPAAGVLALACIFELIRLTASESAASAVDAYGSIGCLTLATVPWVALAGLRKRGPETSEFDWMWCRFRDRFGLVWGQRLREQFNRSAAHAGWPVHLAWQGLRRHSGTPKPSQASEADFLVTLRALMKRFGSAAGMGSPEASS